MPCSTPRNTPEVPLEAPTGGLEVQTSRLGVPTEVPTNVSCSVAHTFNRLSLSKEIERTLILPTDFLYLCDKTRGCKQAINREDMLKNPRHDQPVIVSVKEYITEYP